MKRNTPTEGEVYVAFLIGTFFGSLLVAAYNKPVMRALNSLKMGVRASKVRGKEFSISPPLVEKDEIEAPAFTFGPLDKEQAKEALHKSFL